MNKGMSYYLKQLPGGALWKKLFRKISRNSHRNTCDEVLSATSLFCRKPINVLLYSIADRGFRATWRSSFEINHCEFPKLIYEDRKIQMKFLKTTIWWSVYYVAGLLLATFLKSLAYNLRLTIISQDFFWWAALTPLQSFIHSI